MQTTSSLDRIAFSALKRHRRKRSALFKFILCYFILVAAALFYFL